MTNPSEIPDYLNLVVTAAGIFVTVFGALIGWLSHRVDKVHEEHQAFRVEVAKDYVTSAALQRVETNIGDLIKDLKTDLGRRIDRLDHRNPAEGS